MRRVVIHIGFPKTGTTTLQRAVFPTLVGDEVGYLGVAPDGAIRSDLAHLRWRRGMVGLRPEWFRPRVTLASLLRARHLVGTPAETLLISEEQLLVDPLLDALTERRRAPDAIRAMFGRLRRFLPSDLDIRIIMTIRRQEELVPAFVAQMAHRVARQRHRRLSHAIDAIERPGSSLREAFSFDEVAGIARTTLRPTSITLLPLELLASDAARFVAALADAVGTDGSGAATMPSLYSRRLDEGKWTTSYGPVSSLVHRAYARLALPLPPEWAKRRSEFSDTPRPRRDPPVVERTETDRERLRRQFAASNARVAAATGLDLEGLGYATR